MYEMDQYTVSLLHFEDGIKDECGNSWSIQNNGVSINQAQIKDGSGSAYFNSTGGIYTASSSKFAFDTGDFTIDFWMYYIDGNYETNYGNVAVVLDSRSSIGKQPISIGVYSDYKIGFSVCEKVIQSAPGVIKPNNWVHIACVRSKGIGCIFVDGKSVITGDQDVNIAQLFSSFPLYLGGDGNTRSGVGAVKCYLDEFRISNIARWTEEFIPPTDSETETGELLLVVTMAEEVEKEYELSKTEFDAFVNWYDNKSKGIGGPYYTFDKSFKRKDYLVFDKILTFTVTDFTK